MKSSDKKFATAPEYAPLYNELRKQGHFALNIERMDKIISASNKVQENLANLSDNVKCLDCGIPYSEMGLDIVLPHGQWIKIIAPQEDGILCGNCILKRARNIPGATTTHLIIDAV